MRTGCVLLRGSPSPTYHDGTHPRGTREPHPFPTPPWPRGARRGLIPCRGGDGCGCNRWYCRHLGKNVSSHHARPASRPGRQWSRYGHWWGRNRFDRSLFQVRRSGNLLIDGTCRGRLEPCQNPRYDFINQRLIHNPFPRAYSTFVMLNKPFSLISCYPQARLQHTRLEYATAL